MFPLLPKGDQTKLLKFFRLKIFSIFSCAYLREFSKKFETVLKEYSVAGGKLIHEKNQKQKISWPCPFKGKNTKKTDGRLHTGHGNTVLLHMVIGHLSIIKLYPPRKYFVDIPAGDGNVTNLFLQCNEYQTDCSKALLPPLESLLLNGRRCRFIGYHRQIRRGQSPPSPFLVIFCRTDFAAIIPLKACSKRSLSL